MTEAITSEHTERWLPTVPEPERTEVEKDRDRIVHSSAFRRLQGKSQVFGAQTTDFFRNRLTHSLECAQIGRAIAKRSYESDWRTCAETIEDFVTLVEAACLAHDFGHPPFGHNGETALSRSLDRYLDGRLFEGNAQSFRILTYFEPKELGVVEGSERWLGLNLTRGTLKAIQKYPYVETDPRVNRAEPKFSVFDEEDDLAYFRWVWGEARPQKTLATNVMDVSDDIAYACHDFEDGVWAGMFPLYDLMRADDAVIPALHEKLSQKHAKLTSDRLHSALLDLFREAMKVAGFRRKHQKDWSTRPFERTPENVSYLKKLSASLIGIFIDGVTANHRFQAPRGDLQLSIDILTACAWVWMIERSDLRTRQLGQRRIIRELFAGYAREPDMLPRQADLRRIRSLGLTDEQTTSKIRRLIADHIAGMTDHYALRAHEEMYRGRSPFEIRYAY